MSVELTHGDKVFFPADYITKGEVVAYYQKIAPTILPYLRDRPVTLQRYPDGIGQEGFYQKRPSDHFPDRIETVTVEQKTHDEPITYMLVNDLDALLYLVNQGTICFHRQLATKDHIHQPTHLVFDLDPDPATSIDTLRAGVWAVHELLDAHDYTNWAMTTGGAGFHVLAELPGEATYETVKEQAIDLATELIKDHFDLFTRTIHKHDRDKPIYLDMQRNNYGQTAVCPYSIRAKAGAPVATPIDRDELDRIMPQRYHIHNIFRRLGQKNV